MGQPPGILIPYRPRKAQTGIAVKGNLGCKVSQHEHNDYQQPYRQPAFPERSQMSVFL